MWTHFHSSATTNQSCFSRSRAISRLVWTFYMILCFLLLMVCMSQEAVNRHKESEEGETAESPGTLTQYGDSDERSFQTKTSTKKRRSKYYELENKFNKKFDDFNSKLDRLFTLFGDNRCESSPSNTRKDDVSGDKSEPCRDDILSLHDKDDKIDSESD